MGKSINLFVDKRCRGGQNYKYTIVHFIIICDFKLIILNIFKE